LWRAQLENLWRIETNATPSAGVNQRRNMTRNMSYQFFSSTPNVPFLCVCPFLNVTPYQTVSLIWYTSVPAIFSKKKKDVYPLRFSTSSRILPWEIESRWYIIRSIYMHDRSRYSW
jgi:hypothetical protein